MMKSMLFLLGVVWCGMCVADALETRDLVGSWNATTVGDMGQGLIARDSNVSEFREDGSFLSTGGGFIVAAENGVRAVTCGGRDSGKWEIKDGKLHVRTITIEIDLFASLLEELGRKEFDELIPDLLKEVEVYETVSVAKNKIVLKDSEGLTLTIRRMPEELEKKGGDEIVDPTVREGVREDPLGERYRLTSSRILGFEGFKAAKSLPTWKRRKGVGQEVRPKGEILDRVLCSYAAISWVVMNEEDLPSENIRAFLEKNKLRGELTEDEKDILGTKRGEAAEKFGATVGWQMENIWALAWVLGFEEMPDINQDQIGPEVLRPLWEFLSSAGEGKDKFLKELKVRPLNEVVQLEDLFYCAHNAVRSAQNGKKECLPEHFHPVRHGGIIHEKRHALTWILSPRVKWDDTDLST